MSPGHVQKLQIAAEEFIRATTKLGQSKNFGE